MHIQVVLERVKGNGYRARGTEPFALTARGATRDEALAKLKTKIEDRFKKGMEVVELEIIESINHETIRRTLKETV